MPKKWTNIILSLVSKKMVHFLLVYRLAYLLALIKWKNTNWFFKLRNWLKFLWIAYLKIYDWRFLNLQFYLKTTASKHWWIAFRTFQLYKFVSITLNRSFTIKWHSPWNLNRQNTFRELFILIVKSRLTSVKQTFTNRRCVKTIKQSN